MLVPISMFFPEDNCSHLLTACGQELLMLISMHTLPAFGTPCVSISQAMHLRGAVWLVLIGVRKDDACLLRCRSVLLFSLFLFPHYAVEWREEPGGPGKEQVHKMKKAWCPELLYGSASSPRPVLDFTWVGNNIIVQVAPWLGASPSQQHLSWLCHLMLNSYPSLLHFSP